MYVLCLQYTVAVTKKFTFLIMPLPLHGLTVTVQGRAITVPIKITCITLCDNELRAFLTQTAMPF